MTGYIASACFFLLAGTYLYGTLKLPLLKSSDPMGPRAFPALLGIALAFGAMLLLIETIRARAQADKKEKKPQEEKQKHAAMLWAVVAWTIVFLFLFEPLGYIVSTTIYILPLMIFFNPKKWWANGITSVLFPIGVYILFVKFLGVMLPKGVINW